MLQQDGTDPEEAAEGRSSPAPCILMQGTLDEPGNVYICADKQIIYRNNCGLVQATLGIMSFFYVFFISVSSRVTKLLCLSSKVHPPCPGWTNAPFLCY